MEFFSEIYECYYEIVAQILAHADENGVSDFSLTMPRSRKLPMFFGTLCLSGKKDSSIIMTAMKYTSLKEKDDYKDDVTIQKTAQISYEVFMRDSYDTEPSTCSSKTGIMLWNVLCCTLPTMTRTQGNSTKTLGNAVFTMIPPWKQNC